MQSIKISQGRAAAWLSVPRRQGRVAGGRVLSSLAFADGARSGGQVPRCRPRAGVPGATHPSPLLARLGRGLQSQHSAQLSPRDLRKAFYLSSACTPGEGDLLLLQTEKFREEEGKVFALHPSLAALLETGSVCTEWGRGEKCKDPEPQRLIWGKKGPQTPAGRESRGENGDSGPRNRRKRGFLKKWASHFVRVSFLPEASAGAPLSQPPGHSQTRSLSGSRQSLPTLKMNFTDKARFQRQLPAREAQPPPA